MAKYRKKPVVIEAITFEEFIEYGKNNGGNIVNGFPWSFEYNGHPVTHENDECYLIPTLEGTHHFTPKDMLITGVQGEIYPCKLDIFEATYETVEVKIDNTARFMVAFENAEFMLEEYKKLPAGAFGAINIANAIQRYKNGERTDELLEELEGIQ